MFFLEKYVIFDLLLIPDFHILRLLDFQIPAFGDITRFPDSRTPPVPDELSHPNRIPYSTHPGIAYVARSCDRKPHGIMLMKFLSPNRQL